MAIHVDCRLFFRFVVSRVSKKKKELDGRIEQHTNRNFFRFRRLDGLQLQDLPKVEVK